jgi:RimJ/RimL family protein N-acetyltransferase
MLLFPGVSLGCFFCCRDKERAEAYVDQGVGMNSQDLLRGEKIRLSALTKDDVPTVTRWYENPEFMRLVDSTPAHPRPPSSTEEWMEEAHKSKNGFLFGIRTVEGNKLISLVELDGIEAAWCGPVRRRDRRVGLLGQGLRA